MLPSFFLPTRINCIKQIMGGTVMRHLIQNALPFLLMLPALLPMSGRQVLCFLSAVLLHECGHLAAFLWLGLRFPELHCGPSVLRLQAKNLLTYRQEALIAAAGPALNLIVCLILLIGLRSFCFGAAIHLGLALINLFPADGTDGGRLLSSLLCLHCKIDRAEHICRIVYAVSACLALFISLYFLLCGSTHFSGFFWSLTFFTGALMNFEKSRG